MFAKGGIVRIIRNVMVGASILMLGGCGSDSPKDLVDNYIKAWNKGSLEEVDKYVNRETKKDLGEQIESCVNAKSQNIVRELRKKYIKEVDLMWNKNNPFLVLNKMKSLPKPPKELMQNKTLSKAEKFEKLGEYILNNLDSFKNLKSEMSPIAYKMFAFLLANKLVAISGNWFEAVDSYSRNKFFDNLIVKDLSDNHDKTILNIENSCKEDIFHPGTIKKVNIIEEKKIAPDKVVVRVELVTDTGSTKKQINVEKFNEKWLVTTEL